MSGELHTRQTIADSARAAAEAKAAGAEPVNPYAAGTEAATAWDAYFARYSDALVPESEGSA